MVTTVSIAKVMKKLYRDGYVDERLLEPVFVARVDDYIARTYRHQWTYEKMSRVRSQLKAAWKLARHRGERFDAWTWFDQAVK